MANFARTINQLFMDDKKISVNSTKAWLLASRPKTLIGAVIPVMIGIGCAVSSFGQQVRIIPACLCLLFAFVMQIDANFVNDYFDYMKGTDDETRLGPKRACAQGWITGAAMRRGIATVSILACLVGLPLVMYGGIYMILVGFACLLFCFVYTVSFSYLGLGDLLVLVFFGIVPVCLTYWLMSPHPFTTGIPVGVVANSVACGLVIDTMLLVNNYRDIDNDRRSGKNTLVVRIGRRPTEILFLLLPFCAVIVNVAFCGHRLSVLSFLPVLYLPLHIKTYLRMKQIGKGRALNGILGENSRNMLVYGIWATLAIVFG